MSFLVLAEQAARAAGKIHLDYQMKGFSVDTKSSDQDLVSTADLEAEKRIVEIIKKEFPHHNVLAEEEKYEKTDSEYLWIIDPLDGTSNFSKGLPVFCCSIALYKAGEPILGVVYDPNRDELFSAVKGRGAHLNGKSIQVRKHAGLKDALLVTGFYYDRGKAMKDTLDQIKQFFQEGILGIRRSGSAALDLCYVGAGRYDGFWEHKGNPWDYAAGKLIVQEAGGKVTDQEGKEVLLEETSVLAASPRLHSAMQQSLGQNL